MKKIKVGIVIDFVKGLGCSYLFDCSFMGSEVLKYLYKTQLCKIFHLNGIFLEGRRVIKCLTGR
jgi:hypothetical protein